MIQIERIKEDGTKQQQLRAKYQDYKDKVKKANQNI